jgi:hypothetical protein
MPSSTGPSLRSKATSRSLGSGFNPAAISGRSSKSYALPSTSRSSETPKSSGSWWSRLKAPFSSKSTTGFGGMGSKAPGRTMKSQMSQTEGW